MVVSTGIKSINLGSNSVYYMYVGGDQTWPPLNPSGLFLANVSRNCCVQLNITSSAKIANSGIFWGNASRSDIFSGNNTYYVSFGSGSCNEPSVPNIFWRNFSKNSCVAMTISSSATVFNSGINWGDGLSIDLQSGNVLYTKSYGNGAC